MMSVASITSSMRRVTRGMQGKEEWDDISDLSPSERSSMMEWYQSFLGKYPQRYVNFMMMTMLLLLLMMMMNKILIFLVVLFLLSI